MRFRDLRPWPLAALALAPLLFGCDRGAAPSTAPAPPAITTADIERETARLNEWFDARYEEQLDFSPIEKTTLGRKDDYDKIDDLSESAADAQLAWQRQTVDELRASFDRALLTAEGQTSYDLWIYQLERAEAAVPFRRRFFFFSQMRGMHTQLPQVLINFHRVDDEADMLAYVARIGEAGRALRQVLERAQLAAAEGFHAPRFAYAAVGRQARAVVTGAPFGGTGDSPLWADANTKIDALVANGKLTPARAAELRTAAAGALTASLKPAYDALIAWTDAELAGVGETANGVWALPDGPALYAERLVEHTTTSMSADEIHELGLAEVARIRGEMEAIKAAVGFDGSLQDFFAFIRSDARFVFPNTDEGREAYLQASRDFYAGIEARLPEFFGIRPKGGLVVKRVEPFREVAGQAQHYMQGTPDGSRPGTYYVHLLDMRSMPKPDMESVAYHEGIPGHHMQIAIAQELTGVPQFRTQAGFNAFIEGWGLYAERLAKEMGGYQDPYSDFGRLSAEIWRAIRLVVDTGLHAKQWSEQQAVDYFLANSAISEGQIREEVRRYLVMPGQATAYKVGMLKILELRARAEAALGARFDIRAFHDTVLGGGALPLPILERRVDEWLARAATEDWQALFNGRDLDGWMPKIRGYAAGENPADTFRVADGLLTVAYDGYDTFDDRFGHLFYREPFSHYRLRLEYRFIGEQARGAPSWALRNSGVMVHAQPPETMTMSQDFPISLEVQFLGGLGDGMPRPTGNLCSPGTRVIYAGQPDTTHCIGSSAPTIDGDEWVRAEVLVQGSERIVHSINGVPVIEYGDVTYGGGNVSAFRPEQKPDGEPLGAGYIALQSESHPIQFRRIELLNLKGCMDSKAGNYRRYYVAAEPHSCRY